MDGVTLERAAPQLLMSAILRSDARTVRAICRLVAINTALPYVIDSQQYQDVPLQLALLYSSIDTVRALLECGAQRYAGLYEDVYDTLLDRLDRAENRAAVHDAFRDLDRLLALLEPFETLDATDRRALQRIESLRQED